jgi:hypothetical protein
MPLVELAALLAGVVCCHLRLLLHHHKEDDDGHLLPMVFRLGGCCPESNPELAKEEC